MQVTVDTLDEFVARTDALGGPGSAGAASLWGGFAYAPRAHVDTALDPDGTAYADQMHALYEELAGRRLDQAVTEMTPLDVDALVAKESPYHFAGPIDRATHYSRLAKAVRASGLERGARIVDMGCGWGLSSEFLATLGFDVVAVDINPLFVDLVTRRARRLGLPIRVVQSAFDDHVEPPRSVDGVLFYECLHHAVDVRRLLKRVASWLRPNGVLLAAGEPIQSHYWPHWGFRLDPLSVYCIRKFGWWESGWSGGYLSDCLAGAGLQPTLHDDPDPVIGTFAVARRNVRSMDAAALAAAAPPADWWLDGSYLVSNRAGERSALDLELPPGAEIDLRIHNFSPAALTIALTIDGERFVHRLVPGVNTVAVRQKAAGGRRRWVFECASWCPATTIGNGDGRRLGFHVESLWITPPT